MSLNKNSGPIITIYGNECGVITILPMGVVCVSSNPSSYFASDGEVSLLISGGTPPYVVTWGDDNSVGQNRINLPNGSYTATTVDYYGDFTSVTVCDIHTNVDCNFSGSSVEYNPPVCFLTQGDGWNYRCSVLPLGKYNGKPYYQMLSNDCVTPLTDLYIWWNNTLNRWEFRYGNLGDETTPLYSYLENNLDFPVSGIGVEWSPSEFYYSIISGSVLGECPIIP